MKDDKVVVFKTFMLPFDAYIVKGLQDGHEITCFVTNELFALRNSVYNSGVNEMKLNVFEKDLPKINELINAEYISLEDGRETYP